MLIIASAVLLNISYIKQIKNRTEALRQVYLMIDYIEISIKYQSLDLKDIFRHIYNSDKFKLLVFLKDFKKSDFSSDFSQYSFRSLKNANMFSPYSCELLNGFFSMLGKSDVDGQILNCETYKKFFKAEQECVQAEEEQKIKTGSALLLGVMLLLLIIIS